MAKKHNQGQHRSFYFPIRWMLIIYDDIIYASIVAFALFLYRGHALTDLQILWHFLIGVSLITLSRFFWRVYSQIWRYGGVQSYIRLMFADTSALVTYAILNFIFDKTNSGVGYLRFVVIVLIIFANTLICLAVRMVYRYIYKTLNRNTKFGRFIVKCINIFGRSDWTLTTGDPVNKIKIAIIGAGGVGIGLAEELLNNPNSS